MEKLSYNRVTERHRTLTLLRLSSTSPVQPTSRRACDDLLTFGVYCCCDTLALRPTFTDELTGRRTSVSIGTGNKISLPFVIRTTAPKTSNRCLSSTSKVPCVQNQGIDGKESETQRDTMHTSAYDDLCACMVPVPSCKP